MTQINLMLDRRTVTQEIAFEFEDEEKKYNGTLFVKKEAGQILYEIVWVIKPDADKLIKYKEFIITKFLEEKF